MSDLESRERRKYQILKTSAKCLAVVAVLLGAGPTNASVITSLPGGTTIPMPPVNAITTGTGDCVPEAGPCFPEVFNGIRWSTNGTDSLFGGTATLPLFGQNGIWTGGFLASHPAADLFDIIGTMEFQLPSSVKAIGGFINYYEPPLPGLIPSIAVGDASGHVIEQTTLDFGPFGNDAINEGRFVGFEESTPDIRYFWLSDDVIGVTNLTMIPAVPEPSPLALLVLGVLGLSVGALGRVCCHCQR